jgi:divalent metal cation (Fe/Co/Zn/Cd) transporter
MPAIEDAARLALVQRGRKLEYLTLGWNTLEGLVAIAAGTTAGSVSLTAFGLDSVIELTSGAALLWRMAVDSDAELRARNERRALRIVGLCFIALAAYIVYESGSDLLFHRTPERSIPGIFLACASLVAMPLLSRAKRRVARQLNSAAMRADAKQSEFCAWLSGILLAGLFLNAAFGMWWGDPAAALVMSPLIVREGVEALRGEHCSDCFE